MRRRVAALTAGVMLLFAGHPVVANNGGGGCGGDYTKPTSCHLMFRGFPITVFGDVIGSGARTVHVTVTVEDLRTTPVVLLECRAQGSGYASCSGGVPDETSDPIDEPLLQQFGLRCAVQANGHGKYRCVSGSGR